MMNLTPLLIVDMLHSDGEPEYYGVSDFRIGATLVINGHHFEISEATSGSGFYK